MGLRIWAWAMTWWTDAADASRKGDEWLGLRTWHERVQRYFRPAHCFLACGTWSEPRFSPLPLDVVVVNAGLPLGTPYDIYYTQLSGCGFTAAMAYALNRRDAWDLLVFLDTDVLVGAVDFDALTRDFMGRDEVLLGQGWWNGIGGPLYMWKPAGAVKLLHSRVRANLLPVPANTDAPKPMLMEDELAAIYAGCWWNPWPDNKRAMRQDYGLIDPERDNALVLKWPFVSRPDPAIAEEYERTQTSRAKPVSP